MRTAVERFPRKGLIRGAALPYAARQQEQHMSARQLVEKYYSAWTTRDFSTARACLADNLDFKGSIDTLDSADALMEALKRFTSMVTNVRLIMSAFEGDRAALLYDCETPTPAGAIRTAEFFTVRDGKIAEIRVVFDATELRKLMPASKP
jgi:ketosteroid isomerase-like protein